MKQSHEARVTKLEGWGSLSEEPGRGSWSTRTGHSVQWYRPSSGCAARMSLRTDLEVEDMADAVVCPAGHSHREAGSITEFRVSLPSTR
jgi:hypothetical protein